MRITRLAPGNRWQEHTGSASAVRAGALVAVPATAGADDTGEVASPDIEQQTEAALRNVERALAKLGASLEHVVVLRVYTVDVARVDAMGRALRRRLGRVWPAITFVEVTRLSDPIHQVEIEALAVVEDS